MTLLDQIVRTSARVARTRARLAKVRELATLLAAPAPDEIRVAVSYLSGELPQGRIGVGYATVREVSAQIVPADEPVLPLLEVDRRLAAIATASGPGSRGRRQEALADLLRRATAEERSFVGRLLVGELRQGALEGVMAEAIAEAAKVPAAHVRRAVMLRGDLAEVAAAVLARGPEGLEDFRLELFRPLKPMLADSAEDVEDALQRVGAASLEWKLDGARIQVHRRDGEVRVFSRRLNEVTAAVPEIVEAVGALPGDALMLDGEAIAMRADGTPLPFQVTMRRFGRRLNVAALRRQIPLAAFFFDCLHRSGEDLIDRPAGERLDALSEAVAPALIVPRIVTADAAEARAFLEDALRRGHEGVMAKSLEAGYAAGRRGASWLKIKPAHTLDLVVLAAEWGSGRRRGWLSNLHLGARDPATGGFVMLGKTFKGMTDRMLAWQTRRLQEIEVARDEWTVHVRPQVVVEVAFDGVQASPHYPGGLALRFARVKRYREDKAASDADTIETVRAIHEGGGRGGR